MASRLLWASRAASLLGISVPYREFASVVEGLKYVESHEWVKVDGNSARVGITDHAQNHLGDIVYVELPELVSGKVVEVNEELNEHPDLVNSSPYTQGWMIKVELKDAGALYNLKDADDYSKFCDEEDAQH